MTRDDWLWQLWQFLEARIADAPDDTCRTLARNLWDNTAEALEDEDDAETI